MKYSVDINRSIDSLAYCLQKVSNELYEIADWNIRINAGGADFGIYFNFDAEKKILEISDEPNEYADDSLDLSEIIEAINKEEEDE
jgi:hypothetical protein